MSLGSVSFQSLYESFRLPHKRKLADWLRAAIAEEGKQAGTLSIVLCTDEYLLSVNRQFLNHDYFTDIITFQYSENQEVSGDLVISVDRVRENARDFGVSFSEEMHRVLVHGVLHLCGYSDKTKAQQQRMRKKENYYLDKRNF